MTWQRINLADDAYAKPSEPPITCGLIYAGKRHTIFGPPEAAKTLFALIAGLEHSRAGHGAFGIVDFEMGEHATRLLLADLGATIDEIADIYYVAADGPPELNEVEDVQTAGVTFLVIDAAAGAYDATGLDDSKRQDIEPFARTWVKPFWERGIATVLIDHVVKNADNRGKYSIGSERKLAQVDVALGLEAAKQLHRGGDGVIRITTHKDRPGHLNRPRAGELELHSHPDTHRVTWQFNDPTKEAPAETGGFQPTVLMERVSDYLARQTDPVSRNTIARDISGRKEWILKAVDALMDAGHVAPSGGNGRLSLVSAYPVPEQFPAVPGTTPVDRFPGSHPLQGEPEPEPEPNDPNTHRFPEPPQLTTEEIAA